MVWIESHQEIARHPKTRRLARLLGVSVPAAIGHLHLLWWFALDYAQDGVLAEYDNAEVADAAMWDGDADLFWRSLVSAGFIDEAGGPSRIHDWDDYAGKLTDRRKANAERMRNARSARAEHVQRTSGTRADTCRATVPDLTVPDLNRTGPNSTGPVTVTSGESESGSRALARETDPPKTIEIPTELFALGAELGYPRARVESMRDDFLAKKRSQGAVSFDWLSELEHWIRREEAYHPPTTAEWAVVQREQRNGVG